MSAARGILDAALDAALVQADGLAAEYRVKLKGFRAHAEVVLAGVEAGTVTPEQALAAVEQSLNAVKSVLLAGAIDARTRLAEGGLAIIAAVLRALLAGAA